VSARTTSERIVAAAVRLASNLGLAAATLALGATALLALAAASALAVPNLTLHAGFNPERLGLSTTVDLRILIAPGDEPIPPPLTQAEVRYPAGLDPELSGLGIDACSATTLEALGIGACPPDSLMGDGQAIAEFLIGRHIVREVADLTAVRTTEQEGHLTMLMYLYDETAVSTQLILTGRLLPADGPFAGLLDIHVPLLQSIAGAPDVSVAEIQLGLGPESLTYYENTAGKVIHYIPEGIDLPKRCPRGGFPFAVTLGFVDGSHASARTAVPCPARAARRREPALPTAGPFLSAMRHNNIHS
jgi:hypothetical protein